jgi:MFS family permease
MPDNDDPGLRSQHCGPFRRSTLIEPIKAEFALSGGEVGLLTGATMAIFYVSAGIPLGALADRAGRKHMVVLSHRDPRDQAWFVSLAKLLGTIPSIIAFLARSDSVAPTASWLFVPLIYLYIGPTLALAQNLVPAGMRSQICAFLFSANIANLAVATLLIGAVSDLLSPHLSNPILGTSLTGFWVLGGREGAISHCPVAGCIMSY